MLQNITVLFSDMTNICENADFFAEQYRCATVLYLLSFLAHKYNIKIDHGVGAPVHDIEVSDGLNSTVISFVTE